MKSLILLMLMCCCSLAGDNFRVVTKDIDIESDEWGSIRIASDVFTTSASTARVYVSINKLSKDLKGKAKLCIHGYHILGASHLPLITKEYEWDGVFNFYALSDIPIASPEYKVFMKLTDVKPKTKYKVIFTILELDE
ncbi:hypothetical protein [Rubritalea squalenifaciens]|nr:hypothetical protein [Rubritalea squalenifaciens]